MTFTELNNHSVRPEPRGEHKDICPYCEAKVASASSLVAHKGVRVVSWHCLADERHHGSYRVRAEK